MGTVIAFGFVFVVVPIYCWIKWQETKAQGVRDQEALQRDRERRGK